MIRKIVRKEEQKRRHARSRKKIFGTAERPRVVVYKSNRYLYVQAVNDLEKKTLAALTSRSLKDGEDGKSSKGLVAAQALGDGFAKILKKEGITQLVFDRNGYPYHGRVQALAEGLRKGGMKF